MTSAEQIELDIKDKQSFWAKLKKCIANKSSFIYECAVVFVLFFGRYLYYGFSYFTQLDDYIQLHNYASYWNVEYSSLWELVIGKGMLEQRPIAGLFDVYFYSRLWGHLIVAVLIIALMYSFASVLLYRVFNKLFGVGYTFLFVLTLIPCASEGLYWLSASNRIVPAFLFATLATYFVYKLLDTNRFGYAPLFAIAQLLTYTYYEQVAVLSIVLCLLVGIKKRGKSIYALFLLLSNALIFVLFDVIADISIQSGIYASRDSLALPFITPNYFTQVLPATLKQIWGAFRGYLPDVFFKSAFVGAKRILEDNGYIYLLLLIAVCVGLFFLLKRIAKNQPFEKKKNMLCQIAWGVVLFVAPLAPFFVLSGNWIGLRAIVPCLSGLALLCDVVVRLVVAKRHKILSYFYVAIIFLACLGSCAEMADYHTITQYDTAMAQDIYDGIMPELSSSTYTMKSKVAILNINSSPTGSSTYAYHEHTASCTDATWSATGLIRCVSGDGSLPLITVMSVDSENGYFYNAASAEANNLENYDFIFAYIDGDYIPVTMVRGFAEQDYEISTNYTSYLLYSKDLNRVARVAQYSDHGVFKLY